MEVIQHERCAAYNWIKALPNEEEIAAMMKPLLERAARALCTLDGHPENIKMDGKPMWHDYIPEARAVLTAIREPSHAMLRAAEQIDHAAPGVTDAAGEWRAMIDTALKEQF